MFAKFVFSICLFSSLNLVSQTRTSLECIDREFAIVVHTVKDSLRVPVATVAGVNAAVSALNKEWKPICVKFNVCDIRYVENFNFLRWHKDTMETEFKALYFEPRVINIIVVDTIIYPQNITGYATLGGISSRGLPIIVVAGTGSVLWIHEMGHYFGLEHTFASPLGLANNSNCSSTSDNICDTPPDPYSNPIPEPKVGANYDPLTCKCTVGIKDGNNQYYNPLLENYMSYFGSCRKSFTHMQYEKMVNTYKIDPEAHF